MHRLFLGFSLSTLCFAILTTGCNKSGEPQPAVAQVKEHRESAGFE